MLPNGPSQMNEILRCLFLFLISLSHPFCTSSSSTSSLPFDPPCSPFILSTNLPLVKLFPRSLCLCLPLIIWGPALLATTLLGLIHTDQGCKCDIVYHCAVPSHRGNFLCKWGKEEDFYLRSYFCKEFVCFYYIWRNPLPSQIIQQWAVRLNHNQSAMSAQMGGQSYMSGANYWCVILQAMLGPPCQTE